MFRAARHGFNMDGKLARLRKQDEELLAAASADWNAETTTNLTGIIITYFYDDKKQIYTYYTLMNIKHLFY